MQCDGPALMQAPNFTRPEDGAKNNDWRIPSGTSYKRVSGSKLSAPMLRAAHRNNALHVPLDLQFFEPRLSYTSTFASQE